MKKFNFTQVGYLSILFLLMCSFNYLGNIQKQEYLLLKIHYEGSKYCPECSSQFVLCPESILNESYRKNDKYGFFEEYLEHYYNCKFVLNTPGAPPLLGCCKYGDLDTYSVFEDKDSKDSIHAFDNISDSNDCERLIKGAHMYDINLYGEKFHISLVKVSCVYCCCKSRIYGPNAASSKIDSEAVIRQVYSIKPVTKDEADKFVKLFNNFREVTDKQVKKIH